jgi:hypothetical protein
MNEILNAMIESLLADSQKEIEAASTERAGGPPDHMWTARMTAAIMLRATASALIKVKETIR